MIATPRHFVAAPPVLRPSALRRTSFALLVALLLAFVPSAAHAAAGGVAVDPSTTASGATATAPATAATATGPRPKPVGKSLVRRAQTLLRLPVTGRHDTATRKAVKRFQRLRGIAPFGIIDVTTYIQVKDAFALLTTGGTSIDPGTDTSGGVTPTSAPAPVFPANLAPITAQEQTLLDKIAKCESGGDPTQVSGAGGKFRGKYQFDRATWKTVGGSGDPAAASEAEQDQRAAMLLRQRGTAPWPVCGR